MKLCKNQNKVGHLVLGIFLLIAAISGLFGVWFFNENCCHVTMDLDTTGLTFSLSSRDGNYARHCYCYLTKYYNLGNKYLPSRKETVLYDAVRNPDMSEFNQRWTFAGHDLGMHVAALVRFREFDGTRNVHNLHVFAVCDFPQCGLVFPGFSVHKWTKKAGVEGCFDVVWVKEWKSGRQLRPELLYPPFTLLGAIYINESCRNVLTMQPSVINFRENTIK